MSWKKNVLRLFRGNQGAFVDGRLSVEGLEQDVLIRRDKWGVPYIRAATENDAFFALGFCQGQDRSFQMEGLIRLVRGTLGEMVGPSGVSVDRFSRRFGFLRAGRGFFEKLDDDLKSRFQAFASGVRQGRSKGLRHSPIEFTVLGLKPSAVTEDDLLAIAVLQSLLMSNWASKLARKKILDLDGKDALIQVEPYVFPELKNTQYAEASSPNWGAEMLLSELEALESFVTPSGGSNAWAISGTKTVTGRPILCNDPHLTPLTPNPWYLACLQTPEWKTRGGTFIGVPAVVSGHNEHSAWGITVGYVDNADLFVEDRSSVKVIQKERIKRRFLGAVEDEYRETSNGPVISPGLENVHEAISISATWLKPHRISGILNIHKVKTFSEARELFRDWGVLSLNIIYANKTGDIGWQLVGQPPARKNGLGLIPKKVLQDEENWAGPFSDFDSMPFLYNPGLGLVASANNDPGPSKIHLGLEWMDGYRITRIYELLETKTNWALSDMTAVQRDEYCRQWDDLKPLVQKVLGKMESFEAELLLKWDGHLGADSEGGLIYLLFVEELVRLIIKTICPKSWDYAKGRGFHSLLIPFNLTAARRGSWLVMFFSKATETEREAIIRLALKNIKKLKSRKRKLEFRHPLGRVSVLSEIFNLGPIPTGGDTNTVAQKAVDPLHPLNNPMAVPVMQTQIDVGAWENSRFILAGGQSGDPLSVNYSDQFDLWKQGNLIQLSWEDDDIERSTKARLSLGSMNSG